MIAYHDALHELLRHARRLGAKRCASGDALGRVLAEDVLSPMDLPSFDHAAMDGYALHAAQTLAAGSEHVVQGSQAAGDAGRASAGLAWEIMTGARLPAGLDTVVPVERTELLERHDDGMPRRIRLTEPLAPQANVRYAGSDIAKGALALRAGTRLGPAQRMLLAALGIAGVAVVRRPRVAIICTGKELQPDPTQPLGDGQIYGSNSAYLVAAFAALGAAVVACETVDDTGSSYAAAVRHAQQVGADLIVSTGAVSMGRYDFVPELLAGLGAQVLFHQVAIRPGKPQLAATLGDALVFALPGTPMAVAVGLRFFIAPVLRAMQGQPPEQAWRAVLASEQSLKPGLRHFLRARLAPGEDGRLHAQVLAQQQPFRIHAFAQSQAWVVLDAPAGGVAAGSLVEVVPLHPGEGYGYAWDVAGVSA